MLECWMRSSVAFQNQARPGHAGPPAHATQRALRSRRPLRTRWRVTLSQGKLSSQPARDLEKAGDSFAAIPVNPRLAAISGPLRDSVFPLKDGALSIGRELSNDLIIDDSLVSPKHCRVAFESEHCTVQDLGSLSGTFVNGLPVLERAVDHGDQIVIGGSVFVFLRDEPTIAHPNPVELSDSATTGLGWA